MTTSSFKGKLAIVVSVLAVISCAVFDEDAAFADAEFETVVLAVTIDIKPGNRANVVNPNSKGNLKVSIYGNRRVSVHDIDIGTLLLEGVAPKVKRNGKAMVSIENSNNDKYPDMFASFRIADLADILKASGKDAHLTLTASPGDNLAIAGSDSVTIKPVK